MQIPESHQKLLFLRCSRHQESSQSRILGCAQESKILDDQTRHTINCMVLDIFTYIEHSEIQSKGKYANRYKSQI